MAYTLLDHSNVMIMSKQRNNYYRCYISVITVQAGYEALYQSSESATESHTARLRITRVWLYTVMFDTPIALA